MIVDRKLIEKAKEKLGNQNAFIMAELLELEDFDEKNLKSCCPYHDENTPSFIYNPKNYSMHCFSCNKTVDIIDVLMSKGKTFLESVQFLFDKAEIECSFGEQNVKTKHNYRYPHEEPINDKPNVVDYFGKRGISKNVLDYLDVREDNHGNAVFNFYDTNDVLTMVKYRPSHTVEKHSGQPKTWCQKDSDTAPLLFNMNRVNTSKPLLISEGECDTMSAIEAGYLNTVSVPLGAGNLHWIEENWDWLDTFDDIIIWSDNDAAGEKMRKECIYRLGTWRTKYIVTPEYYEKEDGRKIPLKDINDCLQIGGKQFVMDLISAAKDVPVKSVVDYSEIEELDVSQMDGVQTGIKPLDNELGKLFYGTLTILSGRPGCVDSETEYFNGKCWKKISKYEEGDKVLQYNSDGTANLVYPEQYHKYPCDKFWQLKSNDGINQMISDEHNLVYVNYLDKLTKRNILDFMNSYNPIAVNSQARIIRSFDYNGGGITLTDKEILLMCIAVLGRNTKMISFQECEVTYLKKNTKVRKILDEITSDYQYEYIIDNFEDVKYILKVPTDIDLFLTSMGEYNRKQIELMRSVICAINKENHLPSKVKDFIQFILSSFDYRFPHSSKDSGYSFLDATTIKSVSTGDGYKYCFTVPSGMLVLRRGGDINITGNSGKTSLIDQAIAMTIDNGSPTFLYSKELPERLSANWFNTIIAGRRNMVEKHNSSGKKYYVVPYDTQKKMQQYYNRKLFIYKDEESNDFEAVLKSAEECVRKFGCKLIVLDNLMMLDLKCNESDKNTAQTNLINLLIKFAVKFNVAVVLIAHPRKTQDSNSDIEMYDIAGSSNIINLAMRSIGLRRVSKKEKEDPKCKWHKYDVVLTVMKDRMFGKSDVQIGLWYDLVSRRFYTDYAEYDKQFAWDDNYYIDKLEYVDRGRVNPEDEFPDK